MSNQPAYGPFPPNCQTCGEYVGPAGTATGYVICPHCCGVAFYLATIATPPQPARPDLHQIESEYYRAMFEAHEAKAASRLRLPADPNDDAARARWRAATSRAAAVYHARCAEIEETYASALVAWSVAVGSAVDDPA